MAALQVRRLSHVIFSMFLEIISATMLYRTFSYLSTLVPYILGAKRSRWLVGRHPMTPSLPSATLQISEVLSTK